MLDRARGYGELRLKEALSIHMTPAEECFNGAEDPGLLDRTDETGREEWSSLTFDLRSHPVMYPQQCMAIK